MRTFEYEQSTLREDEQFKNFYAKLCDISNSIYTSGKKLSKSKIVKKNLIILHDGFYSKVTIMEETKNMESMNVEELWDR